MSRLENLRRTLIILGAQALLACLTVAAHASSGGGSASSDGDTGSALVVPEPGAMLVFAAGALVIGYAIRRNRS